jgi:hypothetical protein
MHQLIDLDPGDSTIVLAGVSFIDAAGLGRLVGFATSSSTEDHPRRVCPAGRSPYSSCKWRLCASAMRRGV